MEFVDRYLSDDANHIIEIMMSRHISKNYDEVRNIILGYDYKTGKWISKYGKILANNINEITESIYKYSIPTDSFIKGGGMIFYDDEIFDNVRISMDDVVKRILDILFTISVNVIEYRYLTDMIITEWNMKNATHLYKNNVPYEVYGELHLYPIEIRENSWKTFRNIIKHRGFTIRDAFKLAAIDFLENRVELFREK